MTILNYTLNYVDLIIAGIIIMFAIIGSYKGIVLTVVNFLRFTLGISLCFFTSSVTAEPIYNNYLHESILKWVNDKILINGNIDEISGRINESLSKLPDFVINSLNISPSDISKLSDTGNMADSITNSVIQPIAVIAIKIVVFIAVYIVFFGITGIIISAVRKHNKKEQDKKGKKALKKIDRFIGFVFGILKGAIIVFAFVGVVNALICDFDYSANRFLTTANDSTLFNIIVKYNPFNLITEGIL